MGWTSLVKNLSWVLSCMGSPPLTIAIKLSLWIVMIPPEKKMSWSRFLTNFVCVRFFFLLFCFVLFFRCLLFHCFQTQWFLTDDKLILLLTVNGFETFTTSRTGKTNLLCIFNNYSSSPGYWLRGHEGERNNCFSKIQLVGKKYRDKTTLASKTRFSRHCFGFQSRRFSLLEGYNI